MCFQGHSKANVVGSHVFTFCIQPCLDQGLPSPLKQRLQTYSTDPVEATNTDKTCHVLIQYYPPVHTIVGFREGSGKVVKITTLQEVTLLYHSFKNELFICHCLQIQVKSELN